MKSLIKIAAVALVAVVVAPVGFRSAGAEQTDFFATVDANRDDQISRDELKVAVLKWLGGRDRATADELASGVNAAIPENMFMRAISPPQSSTPKPEDVQKMMAALPDSAFAKPARPRRALVLNRCAGFVHSCIPLAAKTVEEMGKKTGAWTTTVSYDSAVITAENLKQYDLVVLNNTTGQFLDDADPAVTAARKKALLDFVRSGKGLAGIHAASDSYHQSSEASMFGARIASGIVQAADKNEDKAVDAQELGALVDSWFDRADTAKAGVVGIPAFRTVFPRLVFGMGSGGRPARSATPPPAPRQGPDPQIGTWPEYNTMIGGFFKWHWMDPQHIVYRIDDPDSPVTQMFRGGFEIDDETYTFGIKSWSRANLHVLTSVDYAKMSEADKLKEEYPREDHDYGLSWIRREGKGRVFYAAHGHSERVYSIKPMLEHLLAGMQYALGDLKAKDSPSVSSKK